MVVYYAGSSVIYFETYFKICFVKHVDITDCFNNIYFYFYIKLPNQ